MTDAKLDSIEDVTDEWIMEQLIARENELPDEIKVAIKKLTDFIRKNDNEAFIRIVAHNTVLGNELLDKIQERVIRLEKALTVASVHGVINTLKSGDK